MKKLVVSLIMVLSLFLSTFIILTPRVSAGNVIDVTHTLPYSNTSTTWYENTADGLTVSGDAIPSDSWSDETYSVTGPIAISVTITSIDYVGSYYELWMTSDPLLASGWSLVGTTPEVHTGPQLVAPTYNPLWDGIALEDNLPQSSGTFSVSIPAATTDYFRVRNALFDLMGQALDAALGETTSELLLYGGINIGVGSIVVQAHWNPSMAGISFAYNQHYLTVTSTWSGGSPTPSSGWFDWGSSITESVTSPVSGGIGVQYVCIGWFGTGDVPASGTGTTVTFTMNRDSSILWNWKLQYFVTFNQTGIGNDFVGTAVVIDGSNYAVSDLPAGFWYDASTHRHFAFQSPLVVPSGLKQYNWSSTAGLATPQSSAITVNGPGSVTGNYVTCVHDVAVASVVVTIPHCSTKMGTSLWVYQGRQVYVNVTIWDNGTFDENVNVTLFYNATAGETEIGVQNITVLAGQNGTIPFIWDTTGVSYNQNYTLMANATIPMDISPDDNTLSAGPVTVRILGDINGDGKVDGRDITIAARAFGTKPGDPRWNLDSDVNGDGKVDGRDLTLIASNFGK